MKKICLTMLLFLVATFCYSQEKLGREELDISSGYFIGNKEVPKREFKNVLSTNEKAYKEFKRGKFYNTTGIIVGTASTVYLGITIGSGEDVETEEYVGGGLGLLGGLLLIIGGKSLINKSVETYNSSLEEVTFQLGATKDGIGLTVNF
ncbi:hypothetical protein [Mesonia maritima]|uniref:Uncharacterized protein n=1 Tax=Mesonia maritima TaxID=1793873 RepID=A0ABU1K3N1_9FLAO|nr:hypothetical protein [Mesonia maritima]MDR6299916.1 hypothetical protein [Mesonia maritima]